MILIEKKKSKSRSFLELFIFHIYAFKLRVKVRNVLFIINEQNRNLFKKQKKNAIFFFDGQTNILNAILFKMSLFAKYIVISKIISI